MWTRGLHRTKIMFCSKSEPKWMRFFKGYSPVEINFDRSLQNQPSDSLTSFIKTQHREFDFSGLVRSIEKLSKSGFLQQVQGELVARICQSPLKGLVIDKPALLSILSSNNLDFAHNLLVQIVCLNEKELFPQLSLVEAARTIQYINDNGVTNDELNAKFCKNLSEVEESSNYNLEELIILMPLVWKLKPTNYHHFENQFLLKLQNLSEVQMNVDKLLKIHKTKCDIRSLIYQSMANMLDPSLQGTWTSYPEYNQVVQQVFKVLLSDQVRPSERSDLQFILGLIASNQKGRFNNYLQSLYMKILDKYQTIDLNFAHQIMKDVLQKEGQSLAEYMTFLETIGYRECLNSLGVAEHIQRYDLLKPYLQLNFHTIEETNLSVQILSQIVLDTAQPSLQANEEDEETMLRRQFDPYLVRVNSRNQKHGTQTEVKIEDPIHFSIYRRLETLRAETFQKGFNKIHLNTYPSNHPLFTQVDQLTIFLKNDIRMSRLLQLILSEPFQRLFSLYGMLPNLAEDLLYLQAHGLCAFKQLEEFQQKMSSIFNRPAQDVIDHLEQAYSDHQKTIEQKLSFYTQFSITGQLYHKKAFEVSQPENYILKALNSPILEKIVMHSPLKQIIYQALPEMKLNYTEYPAMADLADPEGKVAIFILDASRYLHGANSIPDYHTRMSREFFVSRGYKVLVVDHKYYQINREGIRKEINNQIKNLN